MLVGKDYRNFKHLNALQRSIDMCIAKNAEQSQQVTIGEKTFRASILPVSMNDEMFHISIVLNDISPSIQIEKTLLRRNKELIVTNTLSTAFISSENIDMLHKDLLEKVLLISDFSIGWLMLIEDGEYSLKDNSGVSLEFQNKLKDGRVNHIYGDILGSESPLYILEANEIPDELKKEGIVFLSAIKLKVGKEAIGILVLANRADVVFDFDLASLFSLIGNNLSMIAEKVKLFKKLERLSSIDSLTEIYNARYFYDALNSEIVRSERYPTSFSIVLFDIDNFKLINDTYGHQAGDDVLHSLAGILRDTSRKSDIVARYGGEEFVIILPNTLKMDAFNLATRLKDAVEGSSFLKQSLRVTLSGGIATFPDDAKDVKSLIYAADKAMYEAKAAGKKTIRCHKVEE